MRRGPATVLVTAVTGLLVALSGCTGDGKDGTPDAKGSASPSVSVSATPTKAPMTLTVNGAGVYQLGAKLTALQASNSVAHLESSTGCGEWTVGKGVGAYTDLAVIFFNGALKWVEVDNPTIATPEGVKVGMSLEKAREIYPSATLLSDGLGGSALAVRQAGGLEFLLRIGKSSGNVSSIEAGHADDLEPRFTEGEGC